MNDINFKMNVLEWARKLVFSKSGDAAALAFLSQDCAADPAELRKMDLTAVSSIRKMANGAVELKFIDRIRLIELLLSVEQDQKQPASDPFVEALDRAARRLGADPSGPDGSQGNIDGPEK